MEAVMGNHEDAESGIKFEREYNQICGKMLQEEREKRGISREELARGILSKTALSHMETGRIGWTKLPGDTLMHRMGVAQTGGHLPPAARQARGGGGEAAGIQACVREKGAPGGTVPM